MQSAYATIDLRCRRREIGQRLREARIQAAWTQEQVADFLGCCRAKINRVERGTTELTGIELEMLAQAFNVPLPHFFHRSAE